MTNKEAIKILKEGGDPVSFDLAIDRAIEALKFMNAVDNMGKQIGSRNYDTPTVEYPFYKEAYQTGYEEGKNARTQGEWKATKYYTWECSQCGKSPTIGMGYIQNHTELFNFCPNCGARMGGTT